MNMKCRKCGTENQTGVKFCRHCGTSLVDVKNIMDIYPELNFIPTNMFDWKKPKVGMFVKCVFRIAMFMALIQIIYCFIALSKWDCSYSFYWGCDTYSDPLHLDLYGMTTGNSVGSYRECLFVLLSWLVSCLFGLYIATKIFCNYAKYPKKTTPLNEVADYCQKYSYWGIFRRRKTPKYVFFVKDDLFGILDVAHYSVLLPARYDFLFWREKNKYLNAVINGRNCIIDIYGKELK